MTLNTLKSSLKPKSVLSNSKYPIKITLNPKKL